MTNAIKKLACRFGPEVISNPALLSTLLPVILVGGAAYGICKLVSKK